MCGERVDLETTAASTRHRRGSQDLLTNVTEITIILTHLPGFVVRRIQSASSTSTTWQNKHQHQHHRAPRDAPPSGRPLYQSELDHVADPLSAITRRAGPPTSGYVATRK